MRKESSNGFQMSVIEKAWVIEIGSKETGEIVKTFEFNLGHVETKVPKGGASRDIQQSTGNLEERSVLEADLRFISLNIPQLGLREKMTQ